MRFKTFKTAFIVIIFFSSSISAQVTGLNWLAGVQNSYNGQSLLTKFVSDGQGKIYSIGIYTDSADFDPGLSKFILTRNRPIAGGHYNSYVQVLGVKGDFKLALNMGVGRLTDIAIDNNSNILVVGSLGPKDSVDVDPGSGVHLLKSNGQYGAFVVKLDSTGALLWSKFYQVRQWMAPKVAVDFNDEIIVSGIYSDSVNLDPGTGTHVFYSKGRDDVYIQKLSSLGNLIWAKTIGGKQADQVHGITVDANGDIFVSGLFSDTLDFDPSNSVVNRVALSKSSWANFLLKLNLKGDFKWVAVTQDYTPIQQVVIDSRRNIVVVGRFNDSCDFNPASGSHFLKANGKEDVFIQKLDSNGNFMWARSFGGNENDRGDAVALDLNDDIYVAGSYLDTVNFNPNGKADIRITPFNGSYFVPHSYVLKINSGGTFDWVETFGNMNTNYISRANAIQVKSNGSVVFGGKFGGIVDFDPTSNIKTLETKNKTNVTSFIVSLSQNTTLGRGTSRKLNEFSVYPNPSNDFVFINFKDVIISNLRLLEVNGKVVRIFNDVASSTISLDMSGLSGIYILDVILEDGSRERIKIVAE